MTTQSPVYIEESHGYRIEVRTDFDFSRSNPLQKQYLFEYTVVIRNVAGDSAQLLTRTWHIEDGEGDLRQVKGDHSLQLNSVGLLRLRNTKFAQCRAVPPE